MIKCKKNNGIKGRIIMKKRALALTILLLICIAGLVACADSNGDTESSINNENNIADSEINGDTPVNIIEEVILPIELPEEDFNGRAFNVVTRPFDMTAQIFHMFASEEENGDLINDALYKRTVTIEERFNVNINQITSDGPAQTARRSILAGDDEYNLVIEIGWAGFPLSNENLVVNMHDVPYISDAMAENKPWWDRAFARDMTINGKLYFNAGDIIMHDDILVYVILFNKKLFADNALEYPYQYVRDGTWTYDKMFELTRGLNRNITGDGVMNQFDQWGIMGEYHSSGRLFQSSGQTSIAIGSDGYPYFALEEPRAIDVMNKLMPYIVDGESMFLAEQINNPDDRFSIFRNGSIFSGG
jgi:hypothetical protein